MLINCSTPSDWPKMKFANASLLLSNPSMMAPATFWLPLAPKFHFDKHTTYDILFVCFSTGFCAYFYLENERFGIPTLQMAYGSPLKFAPKSQGPHFVAINPGACKKNMVWYINQFFATPLFCREVFFTMFFHFNHCEYEPCLHAWTLPPKSCHFVKTCSSAMSLHFSHSVLNGL